MRRCSRLGRAGSSAGLALSSFLSLLGTGAASARWAQDVSVPEGFSVEEVVEGLSGPTQIVRHGDDLIVAQLNGGEGDGTGQVLRVSLGDPGDREVLFGALLKPTGVAVFDGDIWVMQERSLSRGPLQGGELEPVLTDLPFNGRSEGTLTVTPDGDLLYSTSGTISGLDAAPGSGVVYAVSPAPGPGEQPAVVAMGFKNAYGRTFDDEGVLWQAEVSDGRYDGELAPDELDVVKPGDDFGWPRCIGDRQPVQFYEGTQEYCDTTPRSYTLFDPGSTPTSVAIAPWDPDEVLVSLWNEGRVVAVRRDNDERPATIDDVITGIDHPQFLLADAERLLVVDFDEGRVLAVQPS